jgi:hypothetical protein
MSRWRKVVAVALAALGLIAAGAVSAPAKAPTVYSVEGCLHAKPEPSHIVFACADAGLYIDGLTWSDWGGTSAHGTGTIHANTCDPYCLAGNFETAPVSVTLYNIQNSTCGKVSGLF